VTEGILAVLYVLIMGLTRFYKTTAFTRRRSWSWSFTEYCKHFVARLNDVRAFGYNYAGGERIWMKFGELRVYCLELYLTKLGCAKGSTSSIVFARWRQWCALPCGHIGTTWRIRRNSPSAAAMRFYVKLLCPLVCSCCLCSWFSPPPACWR